MEKSPISILQELAVMKHLPLPQYNLMPERYGYRCEGVMYGSISAVGVGESKKKAKHQCAQRILNILHHGHGISQVTINVNLYNKTDSVNADGMVHGGVVTPPQQVDMVGKLQQFCKINRKPLPTYTEMDIIGGKFVVQCELFSHVTYGFGTTKKQAKQIAAAEMLKRVGPYDIISNFFKNKWQNQAQEEIQKEKMIDGVVKLFKQFSTPLQQQPFKYYAFPKIVEDVQVEANVETFIEEQLLTDGLKTELENLGVSYIISKYNHNPLVLVLKTAPTANHPSYTFVNSAETYIKALNGLLKKAVDDIKAIYRMNWLR